MSYAAATACTFSLSHPAAISASGTLAGCCWPAQLVFCMLGPIMCLGRWPACCCWLQVVLPSTYDGQVAAATQQLLLEIQQRQQQQQQDDED